SRAHSCGHRSAERLRAVGRATCRIQFSVGRSTAGSRGLWKGRQDRGDHQRWPGYGQVRDCLEAYGELSGAGYNTQHATGSRAFTGNIQKLVGSRAAKQFRYFNGYVDAQTDELD